MTSSTVARTAHWLYRLALREAIAGRYEEALALINIGLWLSPHDRELRYHEITVLFRAEALEKAAARGLQYVAERPGDVDVLALMGDIFGLEERREEALAYWKRALDCLYEAAQAGDTNLGQYDNADMLPCYVVYNLMHMERREEAAHYATMVERIFTNEDTLKEMRDIRKCVEEGRPWPPEEDVKPVDEGPDPCQELKDWHEAAPREIPKTWLVRILVPLGALLGRWRTH
jgi:tetratricopeptide (TPR) repeat protein